MFIAASAGAAVAAEVNSRSDGNPVAQSPESKGRPGHGRTAVRLQLGLGVRAIDGFDVEQPPVGGLGWVWRALPGSAEAIRKVGRPESRT